MKELIDALETRKRYNQMSFDDFLKEYEKYFKRKVPADVIENFKFTGLNNVDFLTIYS